MTKERLIAMKRKLKKLLSEDKADKSLLLLNLGYVTGLIHALYDKESIKQELDNLEKLNFFDI